MSHKEMSDEELWKQYFKAVDEMFFQRLHSSNGYEFYKNKADEFMAEINARKAA